MAIDSHAQGQTTDQVRAFAFDGNGQILEARAGTAAISPPPPPGGPGHPPILPKAISTQVATQTAATFTPTGTYSTDHYAYVNGQQIGEVDEGGDIDVLSGVTGFSDSTTGTRNYVVQAGDTLAGIAQQVYGDASLWYVVADANGLQTDSDLVTGQTLKLPQVTTSSNTAETFKPYDPNAIQGSTTPSLPHAPVPPPSADGGCKAGLAVIVVAVVVSIVAPEIAPVLATALGGGLTGAIVGGVMAGVAADTAGQVTADALGLRNGYSWKEAEVAGLTYGISNGVGSELSAAGKAAGGSGTVFATSNGALTTTGEAVMGGVQYLGNYAADKAVGEPAQFSWAGLVANTVGAATASAVGLPTGYDIQHGLAENFGDALAGGLLNGAVTRETSLALGDRRVQSWQQIAEDAFGNALGNAAIAGIEHENQVAEQKQLEATVQKMQSGFSNELQSDIDTQTGATITQQIMNGPTDDQALDAAYAAVTANSPMMTGVNPFQMLGSVYGISYAMASPDDTVSIAYDPAQQAGYTSAFQQTGEASAAKEVADAIGIREQMESQIAQTQDPNTLAALQTDYTKLKYALVSMDAYFDTSIPQLLPASMTRIEDPGILANLNLDQATLNPQDGSKFFAAAYYDSSDNTYVIANRGTVGLFSPSAEADLTQSQGWYTQQYRDAYQIAYQVSQAQASGSLSANVVFTGHSLGGGLAALEALRTGDSAYTFNAAGLNQTTLDDYHLDTANAANIQAISVEGEVLTTAQDSQWPRAALAGMVPVGTLLAPEVSLPMAVGEPSFLPAVSPPVETSQGIEPGTPYSSFATLFHTASLHKISSVISSLYYVGEQAWEGGQ